MKEKNTTLENIISLKTEWDNCDKRIEQIKEELKPLIIDRFKQLNYKEETFEVKVKIAPRKYENKLVTRGFISWMEYFKDTDSDDGISIERHQVVMEDGEWYIGAISLDSLINWKQDRTTD